MAFLKNITNQINQTLSKNANGYDVFDFRVGTIIGTSILLLISGINYFFPLTIPDLPSLRYLLIALQIAAIIASYYITFLKRWANEIGNLFSLLFGALVVCIGYTHEFEIKHAAFALLVIFVLKGMFKVKYTLKIYMIFIYALFFTLILISNIEPSHKTFLLVTVLSFATLGYYVFSVKLDAVAGLEKREKEIAQREAWFRNIFDNVPVGIALVNEHFRAFKFNKYFQDLTGFNESELIDLGMEQLTHPDDTLFGDDFLAFITGGSTQLLEQRIQAKDGKTLWVRVTLSKMDLDDKSYTIAMFNDITVEKTTDIQIKESSRQLKAHNEALEEFSYVISHDLQEPLRMITSFTQIIQKRYLDKLENKEAAKNDFAYVIDGAKRMSNLIKDMLEYSRWSARALPVEKVDTRDVLAATLQNLAFSLSHSHAEINTDNLPTIHANRLMLGQIFQNLISNAIRYAHPERLPIIEIKIEKHYDYILFSCKDNGVGFEDKYKDRIFGIFQRLHPEKTGGTGMGLAICKRVIERQGGNIWAESQLNIGTTFFFTLPYIENIPLDNDIMETYDSYRL